jgi:predicted MFS family arabinose efflux permease
MTRTSILRERGVRALLVAETISVAGSQMTYVVLPWFVLTTSGSPTRVSLVAAAELAPVALFGLASGSVVERIGSRASILVCDAARAVLLAAIPTLYLLDALPFAALLGLVFLVGVFMVPHATAQRVIVPELVGQDAGRVGETHSLLQAALSVASIAGPPIGGVLIGLIGNTNVLYVDAASYAVSFLLVAGWVRPQHVAHGEDEERGVMAGVRFLFRDRLLRVWMLSITGMNVVWSAFAVIFPVLVLERYGDRPQILGWIFGAFGVGSMLGSVVSFRLIGRVDRMLVAASASLGQTAALWLILPDLPWPVVAAAAGITGLFFPFLNAIVITTRTMRTPPALWPSVHTAAVTVAIMLAPVGALVAGPAISAYGLDVVVAAALLANTVVGLTFAGAAMRERSATTPVPAPDSPSV